MKNDSTRGGRKISIPPSVLFSAVGRMDDVDQALTPEAKRAGDLVYVIGETGRDLGGSEIVWQLEALGEQKVVSAPPRLNRDAAWKTYQAVERATGQRLFRSLHAPSIGGLGAGFARVAMGGELGLTLDLDNLPGQPGSALAALFAETPGRFIATVAAEQAGRLEQLLAGVAFGRIGTVTEDASLRISSGNHQVIDCGIETLRQQYKGAAAMAM